jgi:hypothetical protein
MTKKVVVNPKKNLRLLSQQEIESLKAKKGN